MDKETVEAAQAELRKRGGERTAEIVVEWVAQVGARELATSLDTSLSPVVHLALSTLHLFVAAPLLGVWLTFVGWTLYGWFVAPIDMQPVSFLDAFGLMLFVAFVRFYFHAQTPEKPWKSAADKVKHDWTLLTARALAGGWVLLLGWGARWLLAP